MHKVSVIIPTLNEEAHIENLLSDLSGQSHKPYEIIVVDGNSSDKTQSIILKEKNITLLTAKANPAGQRTLGGQKAKGEILVFLDADVRIKDDFLRNVLKLFTARQLSIACPYYKPYNSSLVIRSIYHFFNAMFFLWQKITPSGAGSCIVVTKAVFKKCHGFDDSLIYDDIAFIRKASAYGRFAMLSLSVNVSDRRFHKDGVFTTTLKYFLLSFFFITKQFKFANKIPYRFNHYK